MCNSIFVININIVNTGVIWSRTPLPRTGEFFKLAKQFGKTIHYVSNNSLRTKENYEKLFEASGIEDGVVGINLSDMTVY